MRFGELFSNSWQEYKANFKVFAIIFLLLSIIPTIIYYLVSIPSTLDILKGTQSSLTVFFSGKNSLTIIFGIIALLLNLWMSASFIYNSLYRKKEMSIKETLIGGKKYFWKFFGFSIVYGVFLIGLFLLLIIPGVIFVVFWMFASYILIGENRGILESLKTSHEIIKGRWWRTFGFLLLFCLITAGISWIFAIGAGMINMTFGVPFFTNPFSLESSLEAMIGAISLPSTLIISGFIKQIFNLGAGLIIAPLGILFFKNLYLDMKTGS